MAWSAFAFESEIKPTQWYTLLLADSVPAAWRREYTISEVTNDVEEFRIRNRSCIFILSWNTSSDGVDPVQHRAETVPPGSIHEGEPRNGGGISSVGT